MRCDSVKQWGMGDETGAQMNDWQPTGFLRGLSTGWLCFLVGSHRAAIPA